MIEVLITILGVLAYLFMWAFGIALGLWWGCRTGRLKGIQQEQDRQAQEFKDIAKRLAIVVARQFDNEATRLLDGRG